MPRKITVAEALQEARINAALTQEKLAEMSGVSERTIRYIESGVTTRPQLETATALAIALGLSVTTLHPVIEVEVA